MVRVSLLAAGSAVASRRARRFLAARVVDGAHLYLLVLLVLAEFLPFPLLQRMRWGVLLPDAPEASLIGVHGSTTRVASTCGQGGPTSGSNSL